MMLLIEHTWTFTTSYKGKNPVVFCGVFDSVQDFNRRKADWLNEVRALATVDGVVIREMPDWEFLDVTQKLRQAE